MTTVRLSVLIAALLFLPLAVPLAMPLASAPALAAPAATPPGERNAPKADTPQRRVAEPPPARDEGKPPPHDLGDGDTGDATKPPPAESTPKEMTPPITTKNLSHRLQVSVDIAVGVGAAFMVTYEDTTWCGNDSPDAKNDTFCSGLAPVYMDFGLGFSVLDSLDIIVDFRLGVMKDMVGNRPLMVMPGLRLWIDPKEPFKIGLALQMVIDLTKQEQPTNLPDHYDELDLGARFYAQFQYDFLRYIGIFGRIGLVTTFKKWIGVNLEAQLGVQARFP